MHKNKKKLKVKISAVSYLNTLPFLYGIKNSDLKNEIDLALDIPSDCAKKLLNNEVDLGLVPVAIIPQLKKHYIISDYCIGADGKVDTVALFSDVPLNEIEAIYLDFHSKTSINLVQVLAKEYWDIFPQFLDAKTGFEEKIQGTTAGVIIGDRTFNLPKAFKYKYDLSEEWKKMTGLPFVFACWVANKKLPDSFIEQFNLALKLGEENIDKVIDQSATISKDKLYHYLTQHISYRLNKSKKEALALFINYLHKTQPVKVVVK